jgi:citrate lyase subunit beta/citryl-CoA lyase
VHDIGGQSGAPMPNSRRLRLLLFVPGDSERKQVRAVTSGADALILDLEDSVATTQLPVARRRVAEFVAAWTGYALPELWVRVNALASGLILQDLCAVLSQDEWPVGILLPKVGNAMEVGQVSHYLAALEASRGVPVGRTRLLLLTGETPSGLLALSHLAQDLYSIPAAAGRIDGLTWGSEDLGAALGTSTRANSQGELLFPFQMARVVSQASAAALNVQAIDTVYTNIRDIVGLERELENARRDGFTGKLVIHPDHVEAVNRAFTSSRAELEHAQRIVDAFENAPDAGVVNLDGQMVDRPHLIKARRVLGQLPR